MLYELSSDVQATPTADTAMFYFQTNALGFTPEFLGRVRLAGSLASLAGIAPTTPSFLSACCLLWLVAVTGMQIQYSDYLPKMLSGVPRWEACRRCKTPPPLSRWKMRRARVKALLPRYMLSSAGVAVYNFCLKDVPLRKMFLYTSLLGALLGMTQILLITGRPCTGCEGWLQCHVQDMRVAAAPANKADA